MKICLLFFNLEKLTPLNLPFEKRKEALIEHLQSPDYGGEFLRVN